VRTFDPAAHASRTAHAIRGVGNGVLIGSAAGVVLGLAAVGGVELPQTTSDHSSYAQRLADLHDCWTDRAPGDLAGGLPGGTVIKPADSPAPVYLRSRRAVKVALAHVFEGKHPQVVVYAFCR
jgi:hypothetical protein